MATVMATIEMVETWKAAGRHERTGYPLLDVAEEEQVVRTLAGEPPRPTCADCWWCKGGYDGAPFASGNDSRWMDARCERRYAELLDLENEREADCGNGFGPGYRRDHRADAACGAGTMERREWIERFQREVVEMVPQDRAAHDRWWAYNYPRLGVGNRRPDHPACVHWLSRGPELAKIAAGGRGAGITEIWAELDRAA